MNETENKEILETKEEKSKVIGVKEFNKRREERIEAVSELIIDGATSLQLDDKDFSNKVKSLAELERQVIEEDKNKETEKHNRFTRKLDLAKVIAVVTFGFIEIKRKTDAIKRVTRFEEEGDGAFLTMSSRTQAQDGIREPNDGILSRFTKMFGKW